MNERAGLLFPGQGVQTVGMGRAAYQTSAAARAVFAHAGEVLGYSVSRLCFEGPDDVLRQTNRQQPAILACSLAMLAAARESEAPPGSVMASGHSLGFYAALVAAGALAQEDALRLVALRAEAMQRASEERDGGMAAVLGLPDAEVEDACAAASRPGEPVVAANFNAPGQVVISGATEALARVSALLGERGARKIVPLPVAGAFHSPLMRTAAAAMLPALDTVPIGAPEYPVVANAAPRALGDADSIRNELRGQILAPVRWTGVVRFMAAHGVISFVDCGPGTTLAALIKRISPEIPVIKLDGGA